MTSARSGRTPVRAGGATTFGDVSWGPVAVHSGSIFNHVDVLDLVRVVINLLLRLGLFFPDRTQSHRLRRQEGAQLLRQLLQRLVGGIQPDLCRVRDEGRH